MRESPNQIPTWEKTEMQKGSYKGSLQEYPRKGKTWSEWERYSLWGAEKAFGGHWAHTLREVAPCSAGDFGHKAGILRIS